MKIENHRKYKELLPEEGKVLTNGSVTVSAVAMPLEQDVTPWREIDKPAWADDTTDISDAEALNIILNGYETR